MCPASLLGYRHGMRLGDRASSVRLRWPPWVWHAIWYDLAFSGIVSVLSTAHSLDLPGRQTWWIIFAFMALCTIWLLTTCVMLEVPVTGSRVLLVLAQMVLLLIAAISADVHITDVSDIFGGLLAVALLTVGLLDWTSPKPLFTRRDRVLLLTGALLFVVGIPIQSAWWRLPWGLGVVILGGLGMHVAHRLTDRRALRHRFGEITVIVLGSAVLNGSYRAADAALTWRASIGILIGASLVTVLWWIYFQIPPRVETSGWILAHVPFLLGGVGLGVGMTYLVIDAEQRVAGGLSMALLWPVALALAGLAMLKGRHFPLQALTAGGLALVLAVAGVVLQTAVETHALAVGSAVLALVVAAGVVMAIEAESSSSRR